MALKKAASCLVLALLFSFAATAPSWAQSNTAVGLWKATAFDDPSPTMPDIGTHEICIRADGTWRANTFPNWGGRWFQKGVNAAGMGNHVRLVGNFGNGIGNDAFELDFVSSTLMTGTWSEWVDGLPHLRFVRTSFNRVNFQCDFVPGFTAEDAAKAEKERRTPLSPSQP